MRGHIHTGVVCETATVVIEDVRCRPECCECGAEEVTTHPVFAFVRSGVFVKHVGSREIVGDTNQVVFFDQNRPYRVSHPVAGGDDCTSFTFTEAAVRDVLSVCAPGRAEADSHVLLTDRTPSEPCAALVQQQFRKLACNGGMDSIAIDEISLTLLARLLRSTERQSGDPGSHARSNTRIAHRRLARDAQLYLASSFRESLDLVGIANAVDISPFQLCRVFRRETGWTVHKYLVRLRLRAALEALGEGHEDLTSLALDLGFSSHAHLCDSFRTEFGITPSAARTGLTVAQIRKLSKNLEA